MEILNLLAIWAQIISLPIAIIAILVSIWFYYKGKKRKAIACVFDQIEFPIEIKAGETLDGAIEIFYKGKAVKNIFLVRVRIKNTGTLPIRRSDVIEPLTFTFEPNVVILREPRIIEQNPSNLNAKWEPRKSKTSPQEISFLFDLLNPNDEISAEFICAGNPKLPNIAARIEGVRDIDSFDPEEKRLKKELMGGLELPGIVIIAILVQAIISYFSKSPIKLQEIFLRVVAILVSLAVSGFFVILIWVKILRPFNRFVEYRRKHKKTK